MWTSPPVEALCFLVFHLLSQVHWRQKQLEVESMKGDLVSTKRYWTLPKSRGSQSSVWEERKKIRAKRGSLCEPCKPRKAVTCPGLRVVEPVYHQASLRGRWRSWRRWRRNGRCPLPQAARPGRALCVICQDTSSPFCPLRVWCHGVFFEGPGRATSTSDRV